VKRRERVRRDFDPHLLLFACLGHVLLSMNKPHYVTYDNPATGASDNICSP